MASVTVTVAKHETSLTLSGPDKGMVGKQLRFSGALDVGQASPSRYSLKVLRTVSKGSGTITTTLRSVLPAGDGAFSFADTPTEGGLYTYTVQWAGDTATLSAQASHNVTVKG